jgi:hypothetical protein
MSTSSPEKEKFRQLVRSKVAETTEVCVRKGVEMALGQASLNLIVAGELIKLGSAFAIRLGADEDGVARRARGCYNEAIALARAPPTGSS